MTDGTTMADEKASGSKKSGKKNSSAESTKVTRKKSTSAASKKKVVNKAAVKKTAKKKAVRKKASEKKPISLKPESSNLDSFALIAQQEAEAAEKQEAAVVAAAPVDETPPASVDAAAQNTMVATPGTESSKAVTTPPTPITVDEKAEKDWIVLKLAITAVIFLGVAFFMRSTFEARKADGDLPQAAEAPAKVENTVASNPAVAAKPPQAPATVTIQEATAVPPETAQTAEIIPAKEQQASATDTAGKASSQVANVVPQATAAETFPPPPTPEFLQPKAAPEQQPLQPLPADQMIMIRKTFAPEIFEQ
ncbi:MAG: hypothetical protein PVG66_16030 [Chromatiales bacterium]|jgi:hypothetical protein